MLRRHSCCAAEANVARYVRSAQATGTVVIVVLGLGFGCCSPVEQVHETAGVGGVGLGRGDLSDVRQGLPRMFRYAM